MQIMNPIFFLLSVFIAAVIVFYFFRKQYETKTISSNILWDELLNEWQVSPWLNKLQKNVLFWLQIIVLILLMLAVVRPFWYGDEPAGQRLIFILDTSATMSANDGDLSRLETAKESLLQLVDATKNQEMTIITAGQNPEILVHSEIKKPLIKKDIQQIELSYEHENIEKAMQLAQSLVADKETVIHIFSDAVSEKTFADLPDTQQVEIHNIGENTENLSLLSFGTASNEDGISGIAVVENQNKTKEKIKLQVKGPTDISLFETEITLEPESQSVIDIPILSESPYYEATIIGNDTYLADNHFTAFTSTTNPTIYTVGDVNSFVTKGLEVAGVELIQLDADNKTQAGTNGLIIAEGVGPEEYSGHPLLLLNPSNGKNRGELSVELTGTTDSLLDYVDVEKLYIKAASDPVNLSLETILSSGEIPLIQKGIWNGQPVITLNFSITDSDWPLQPSFPIFLNNAYQWLSQQTNFLGYFQPGEEKWINMEEGQQEVEVFSASGNNLYSLDLKKENFRAPVEPGIYQVVAGTNSLYFSVLLDEKEKVLQTADSFTIEKNKSKSNSVKQIHDGLWFWLAFSALFIVMLEWEVYRRGR